MSNTTGVTRGAGTVYPSGALEFNPVFSGVRDDQILRFLCSPICLCVLFHLVIRAVVVVIGFTTTYAISAYHH
jgi:hypothetical protein